MNLRVLEKAETLSGCWLSKKNSTLGSAVLGSLKSKLMLCLCAIKKCIIISDVVDT
jgi:hypothetical protein